MASYCVSPVPDSLRTSVTCSPSLLSADMVQRHTMNGYKAASVSCGDHFRQLNHPNGHAPSAPAARTQEKMITSSCFPWKLSTVSMRTCNATPCDYKHEDRLKHAPVNLLIVKPHESAGFHQY